MSQDEQPEGAVPCAAPAPSGPEDNQAAAAGLPHRARPARGKSLMPLSSVVTSPRLAALVRPAGLSLARKLIHVAIAWLPALGWLVAFWLELALAWAFLVASLLVELARHRVPAVNRLLWRLLPTVFRAWEDVKILGSTWYALGTLAALLAFGRDVGGTAVLFLAWGDPAAEFAGQWWSRRRAARAGSAPRSRKTAAGSLGCLLACLVAAAVGVGLGGLEVPAALAGAVVAAAVERWSPPPDDNVWIPLASALAMWAVAWLI